MVQKFTSSGEEVTTVCLYHERIALNVYFKIFLLFFFSFFNWNRFSDLNFLFLISSAWLMHEGKGPKMALRHRWSAGDLLSFPCKLASGCPRLDLAPSFSFGCSSPRGAVPQPGITQQLSGHPSSPWIPPADPAFIPEPNGSIPESSGVGDDGKPT